VVERSDDPFRFADMVDPERNLVPQLGILCLELDRRIARMIPRLRHRSAALVIAARTPGSPAWASGFQPGDVLIAVNGQPVRTLAGLRERVQALSTGDPLAVQLERSGQLLYVAFRL
jgi:S1-C subfamily serine protease